MRHKSTEYENRLWAAAIEPCATTAPHLCLVKRDDLKLLLSRIERLERKVLSTRKPIKKPL